MRSGLSRYINEGRKNARKYGLLRYHCLKGRIFLKFSVAFIFWESEVFNNLFIPCFSATEQRLRITKKVNLNLLRTERMARVFTHNYHYSFKSTHRSCDYHLNVRKKNCLRSPLRLLWIVSFWQLSKLTIVWSGLLLLKTKNTSGKFRFDLEV